MLEEEHRKFFTDFDGRFIARLSAVRAVRRTEAPSETLSLIHI